MPAIRKLRDKAGSEVSDVDVVKVRAFAVVAMIAAQDFVIPDDGIDIKGGATALEHLIGASSARIITPLLAALEITAGARALPACASAVARASRSE